MAPLFLNNGPTGRGNNRRKRKRRDKGGRGRGEGRPPPPPPHAASPWSSASPWNRQGATQEEGAVVGRGDTPLVNSNREWGVKDEEKVVVSHDTVTERAMVSDGATEEMEEGEIKD